ncbi:CidB/LrgB family autolysis modulator [Bacillus mangrovi]|uniref:CidB/LrgB family autolysis modulator n=1 Tax=Metabacillus mangrovi TaxID=1491830 RepID=A0A7X2S643_9BACI|nr:LrgB family protein [Metabacillus mangrovi]MTH53466.1 CidB/LrgB family autolysis modulator [Metabacillus mangrovi]
MLIKLLAAATITYMLYRISKWLYRKTGFPLLHPLLITPGLLIVLISVSSVSAAQYTEASRLLTYMLGPATAAFAVPIYKHAGLIKRYTREIFFSVTAGSAAAILSSFLFAFWVHLNGDWMISMLPRSITTPIAIEVSKEIGGLPALTTAFVILTGIIGGMIGPAMIKWLPIHTPIAKGLMLGMAAHGVGTAKAMEYGELEGTFSSLSMILAGFITILWGYSLIPLLILFIS